MRHTKSINADAPLLTVIYCRVSSKKQDIMGDGLASQETRLREDAARKGYNVVRVFRDKLTGGEHKRPGLREMVKFVLSDKQNRYRIFFDHIDRFVRDTFLHKDLRRELEARAAILESPTVIYNGDPSSRLLENITVTFADYHRVNNAEQTLRAVPAYVATAKSLS